MPISVIFGGFTLISMGSKLSLPDIMIFFGVGYNGLVVIIEYFTAMSKLSCGAEDARKFIKGVVVPRISVTKTRKWVGAFLKSLRPLRVCIGSVNYVDRLTPFNLLDYCFSQIVSLLMMD